MGSNLRAPNVIKRILVLLMVFVLILLLAVYLIVESHINSTSCKNLTNIEAVQMIESILQDKAERSKNGRVLFGSKLPFLMPGKITRAESENDQSYIEIEFIHSVNSKIEFSAVIYENCEIQWIKGF